MSVIEEFCDVVVVGAGHAGCEAALACARLGLETYIFTVSVESIALMPCNPNIGGSSKGHLVREVDALGGEMGKNIDRTFIQSKMLNKSKGPAVHSLRAQADKSQYSLSMRKVLENQDHLTIRQQEVAEILTEKIVTVNVSDNQTNYDFSESGNPLDSNCLELKNHLISDCSISSIEVNNGISKTDVRINSNFSEESNQLKNAGLKSDIQINSNTLELEAISGNIADTDSLLKTKVIGIKTVSGAIYHAKAVILCTGVYLSSRCIYGDVSQYTGPNGLMAANHLSDSLRKNGIKLTRFKTGTPARIDKRSIDFSKMAEQKGDEKVIPFSFSTNPEDVQISQESCWLTYTNEDTHKVIRENIDRSPLYGGVIKSTGPRYCPSIEDKVMKFPDKDRHQVFIEPEGRYTNEMYIDGMSSSMPEDVQFAMYRSVPGLENARIVRSAYAIEYDCLAPMQLKSTLEFKSVQGLFSGGQFNGSSGYEEAAAQGLIAGINAAQYIKKKEQITLLRSESYIGVLIDDLVTKENFEPYRMMTSRAEYRLLLRQDNADLRLRKYGYQVGLITQEQMDYVVYKQNAIENEIERVSNVNIAPTKEINEFLVKKGSTLLESGIKLVDLIRRPELSYPELAFIDINRPILQDDIVEQVNIEIKYEGYIRRQKKQVQQFAKTEMKVIPENIDYDDVKSLRIEARQKLKTLRPDNIGQASRIAGVTPADINVLLVYLKQSKERKM